MSQHTKDTLGTLAALAVFGLMCWAGFHAAVVENKAQVQQCHGQCTQDIQCFHRCQAAHFCTAAGDR